MTQIINNCIITHEDSKVLKSYDVTAGTAVYHTGVDIESNSIYSPCPGVCIFTGLIQSKPSCTIQYSQNICLRFTHLKEVKVEQGQIVEYDQEIGLADKYVHFEYLTSERSYPYFRVFFNSTNSYYMYKHDPMLVLLENVKFQNTHIAQTFTHQELWNMYESFKSEYEKYTGEVLEPLRMHEIVHSDLFEDL